MEGRGYWSPIHSHTGRRIFNGATTIKSWSLATNVIDLGAAGLQWGHGMKSVETVCKNSLAISISWSVVSANILIITTQRHVLKQIEIRFIYILKPYHSANPKGFQFSLQVRAIFNCQRASSQFS